MRDNTSFSVDFEIPIKDAIGSRNARNTGIMLGCTSLAIPTMRLFCQVRLATISRTVPEYAWFIIFYDRTATSCD